MNDDWKETIQILSEWKRELDTTVPAFVNTAKQIIMSPEVQAMVGIANRARDVIPEAMKWFAELAGPFAEMAQFFFINVDPFLKELAVFSARLSVIGTFGELQYVAWEALPEELFNRLRGISDPQGVLEVLSRWNNETASVENTIRLLSMNEHLKDNSVFLQAVEAYHRDGYDLAVLGFTVMTDRLLSEYSGQFTSTSIKNRVKAITEKIESSGDIALDEVEINDFVLISTYTRTIELFGASRSFEGDEPELNRHWIAHGRMDRSMEKIDCIRVINILYGTILMNQLSERIAEEEGEI